jgi:hypothetical protein
MVRRIAPLVAEASELIESKQLRRHERKLLLEAFEKKRAISGLSISAVV